MPRAAQSSSCVHKRVHTEIDAMPKHNEPQYKTKANAKGVFYAYTRVDGQQVALGRAGEAAVPATGLIRRCFESFPRLHRTCHSKVFGF